MRSTIVVAFLSATVMSSVTPAVAQQQDPGRLYARVTTLDGEQVEGFVRWDKNEGHWMDVLDASKEIPGRYLEDAGRESRRKRSVSILGVRLNMRSNRGERRQSGMRMGHIKMIQVLDGSHALVTLKSGAEQEFQRSSTDLGNGIQSILVYPADGNAARDFDWNEIDFVEFAPAPSGVVSPFGPRLYGTLELKSGEEFNGWITWDMDEIFGGDELDGDSRGQRQRISFTDIAAIEVVSGNRAAVTLRSGETLTLSGTNDVNSGNRGIAVGDPGLGQVRIKWRQLASVKFEALPGIPGYPEFNGGRELQGSVTGTDGSVHTGTIRWDNDEAYTWEFLDGHAAGAEFKVEFGMIRSIERLGRSGARVELLDGREFELKDSNDVDAGNNGVFVQTELGEKMLISWAEIERVDFTR